VHVTLLSPPFTLVGLLAAESKLQQAASGGEVSLDLDLEMEELGRTTQLRSHPSFSSSLERDDRVSLQEPHKSHSTSSCSSDSDTDDGRKRHDDDGEVVRCTSSSTAAGTRSSCSGSACSSQSQQNRYLLTDDDGFET
jgi:mechanosensitive ion channel protein 4/5/6/7/8/9/10